MYSAASENHGAQGSRDDVCLTLLRIGAQPRSGTSLVVEALPRYG